MGTSTDFAVGSIAGHSHSFRAAHRDGNDTPITTTVTLTVPMSHEDIEGALWWLLRDEGVTFEDIATDDDAVWFLLESMIGHGTSAVESYRLDLADLRPGDPSYEHFLRLRRRVEALVGPRPGSRRTARGRASRSAVTRCPSGADAKAGADQHTEGSHGGHRAPFLISPSHNPQPGTRTQEGARG